MPPATTTSIFGNATSATSVIQKIETTYVPQAQAVGSSARAVYFSHLTELQVISLIVSAAFIAAIIYIAMKTGWVRLRIDRFQDVILKTDLPKKQVEKSWNDIERHFFSGDENELKIAVIKADTLLDEALRESGIRGKDLGERLKRISAAEMPNIDNIWDAHKLRNKIAHEINFTMKRDLAERALTVYEEALEQLGVLTPLSEKIKKGKPTIEERSH